FETICFPRRRRSEIMQITNIHRSRRARRSHRKALRYLVELGALRSSDAGRIMPPLRERTPLSSLSAEAQPARIAPFGNGLELRQAAKRPFPIVAINARSRQIIVTQPHKGPRAARLKQKFDCRLPRRDAADATPGKNDFAMGHNLDVVTFDFHPAGFQA